MNFQYFILVLVFSTAHGFGFGIGGGLDLGGLVSGVAEGVAKIGSSVGSSISGGLQIGGAGGGGGGLHIGGGGGGGGVQQVEIVSKARPQVEVQVREVQRPSSQIIVKEQDPQPEVTQFVVKEQEPLKVTQYVVKETPKVTVRVESDAEMFIRKIKLGVRKELEGALKIHLRNGGQTNDSYTLSASQVWTDVSSCFMTVGKKYKEIAENQAKDDNGNNN